MEKTEVTTMGRNYSISTKYAIAICKFIKGKSIVEAIQLLEKVKLKKVAVPMMAEVGHRKGKGMERGRYPVRASACFINVLKNLRGSAIAKNLEADSTMIKIAKADRGEGSTRVGRRGRGSKRTHILLIGEGREEGRERRAKVKVKDKPKEAKGEKKVEATITEPEKRGEKKEEKKEERAVEKVEQKEPVKEVIETKEKQPEEKKQND